MRIKEPWKPQKPTKARRCPRCKGKGEEMLFDPYHYRTIPVGCGHCGGKGWL